MQGWSKILVEDAIPDSFDVELPDGGIAIIQVETSWQPSKVCDMLRVWAYKKFLPHAAKSIEREHGFF